MASTTKTGETSKAKTDSTVKRSKRRISGGVGLTDEQNAESGFAASKRAEREPAERCSST